MAQPPHGFLKPALLGTLLFVTVAAVFLPAVRFDFVPYDDPVYVTQNAHVLGGLSWAGIRWAFGSVEASNWHPLTWMSHMADCQLFGTEPWGHHLTSVLLHAANALLLFTLLRAMTGAAWRSLLVAALFGLHPLHVESVAWVSERKDVLSTFFGLLSLWAYVASVEAPGGRRGRYLAFQCLALLCLALGLMCKPMLVTLPCVLILLDLWPLGRWARATWVSRGVLLAEKLPYFLMVAAASAATLAAQARGGAVASVVDIPLGVRVAHALVTYCGYLGKCLWPSGLAAFYPFFPEAPPIGQTLAAALLLAAITAAAAALFKTRPYLLIGWLWYVGTLVPVIGLVQVGGQLMADRYTYVPLIGVFIMAVWTAADVSARWAARRLLPACAAGIVVVACTVLTLRQIQYWRDGVSLFRHALDVTDNNWVAHAGLGAALSKQSPSEAESEFQKSVAILSAYAETHNAKGLEFAKSPGRTRDAIREFRTALEIMPNLPDAHFNLGSALAGTPGGQSEAIEEFQAAVRLKPDFAGAHYFLGYLLSRSPGRHAEAIAEYEAVLRLEPSQYQAQFNLGLLLSEIPGRESEAIGHFEAALRINPNLEQARAMIDRLHSAAR
jgi:tetratricopeptide (TPR) repeat protein